MLLPLTAPAARPSCDAASEALGGLAGCEGRLEGKKVAKPQETHTVIGLYRAEPAFGGTTHVQSRRETSSVP